MFVCDYSVVLLLLLIDFIRNRYVFVLDNIVNSK